MDDSARQDPGQIFATPDTASWYQLASRALQGGNPEDLLSSRLHDGFTVKPLYGRYNTHLPETSPSGIFPFARGGTASGATVRGWDIRQEYRHPDLHITNQNILEDLEHGVTSVLLGLDRIVQQGTDGDVNLCNNKAVCDGVLVLTADDLDTALAGVLLEIAPVALRAGNGAWAAAAFLETVWHKRGVMPEEACGAFNIDPAGTLARTGLLIQGYKKALNDLGAFTLRTVRRFPYVSIATADGTVWSDAGATDTQEVACTLSTALLYLRTMIEAGLEPGDACSRITFTLTTGTDFFTGIAKLRAARMTWARIASACGASGPAASMRLHATTAERIMTRRDPWNNILRATTASMAAVLGGADSITTQPPDIALGIPSPESRQIARNIQHILREEAGIGRVLDPAGGSWFLESLTRKMAETAWSHFQKLEQAGGILPGLLDGSIAQALDASWQRMSGKLGCHADRIVGVTSFPAPPCTPEPAPETNHYTLLRGMSARMRTIPRTVQAHTLDEFFRAAGTASLGALSSWLARDQEPTVVPPLPRHRLAEDFEALQDRANDAARAGKRPSVFLACTKGYTDDMTFASNVLLSGGIDVAGINRAESADDIIARFTRTGLSEACLCTHPDMWTSLATQMRQAGATHITAVEGTDATHGTRRNADSILRRNSHAPDFLRACLHRQGALQNVRHP